MQRSEAAKWFWPFIGVAALAAAIVIGLSFVQPKATTGTPDFRMLVTVTAQRPHVAERTRVTIEPSHIVVIGPRTPSILERLLGLLQQRKQPS
ncbi:MAG TPA: hypothetical protein VF814_02975 [Casimicrobiaceae bacterium]